MKSYKTIAKAILYIDKIVRYLSFGRALLFRLF